MTAVNAMPTLVPIHFEEKVMFRCSRVIGLLLCTLAVGCGKRDSSGDAGQGGTITNSPTQPSREVQPVPGKAADPLGDAKARSRASLKAIAAAFERYEQKNGFYPVGLIDPKTGLVGLSWRVQILPYMQDSAAAELYKQFLLDEPWDSATNKPLLAKMPAVFAPPRGTSAAGSTYYQGFADHYLESGGKEIPAGNGSLFGVLRKLDEDSMSTVAFLPDPRFRYIPSAGDTTQGLPIATRKINQIHDGTDNTFLVAEARVAVPWTRPQDIPFEFVLTDSFDPVKGADQTGKWPALGGVFDGDFHAISVSGNALVFVTKTAPVAKIRPFITVSGSVDSDFEGLGVSRPN